MVPTPRSAPRRPRRSATSSEAKRADARRLFDSAPVKRPECAWADLEETPAASGPPRPFS